MSNYTSRRSRAFLFSLLIMIISGCSGTRRPVMYYNLSQTEIEFQQQIDFLHKDLALGIGPIQLPESLSRLQIASRLDSQRLTYSDYNRWSGSLSEDFASVLMEDIAAQLPKETSTALFPWAKHFHPSHRLVVNVSQFDGQLGGEVILTARWTITSSDGKEPLVTRKSTVRITTNGSQYHDLVSAQSQAVADLSSEIATALSTL